MKIAYNHQIFSLQAYGGISRYFIEIVKRIDETKKDQAKIKIFAPFHKNHYLALNKNKMLFTGFKIPNIRGSSKINSFLNSFLSPIQLNYYNPDIVHETYYCIKKTKNRSNVKKIVTVYDMIHELFPEEFSKKDKTSEIKKLSIMQADHVICISKKTQEDLVKILGIDKKKTSVVYLGYTLMADNNYSSNIIEKPYLLYVGSRKGYKNFHRLVEAYANSLEIKNFYNLVVFGGGPFSIEELEFFDLMKIDKHKMKQVTGDDVKLANYYHNASLFVYPSLYEGFGMPPLEAMSFGCPVACSNGGSIPEVVGNAGIFFDPYSIDSIRENIEKILNNNQLRSSIIEKGFQRLKNFSWDKCASETFEVYKKVFNGRY